MHDCVLKRKQHFLVTFEEAFQMEKALLTVPVSKIGPSFSLSKKQCHTQVTAAKNKTLAVLLMASFMCLTIWMNQGMRVQCLCMPVLYVQYTCCNCALALYVTDSSLWTPLISLAHAVQHLLWHLPVLTCLYYYFSQYHLIYLGLWIFQSSRDEKAVSSQWISFFFVYLLL